jgi:hypothetical protein
VRRPPTGVGFHGIFDEIEKHLLEFFRIGRDQRQIFGKLRLIVHVVGAIAGKPPQDVAHESDQTHRHTIELQRPPERAQFLKKRFKTCDFAAQLFRSVE